MDSYHVEALRREIVATSRAIWSRGWVANHDGNLSARLDQPGDADMRLLCSPTAISKGDLRPEQLIVVDGDKQVVEGTRRVFSEIALHLAAYRARPDIGVVLHAHPPIATAYACAGRELPHPFMAEAVVSLGPEIPLVPFHLPGESALDDALGAALGRADVAVLASHGVISVGGSFEQALLRLELVEHLARIAHAAEAIGGVKRLDASAVARLSAKGRPASDPARAPAAAAPPRPASQGSPASQVSPATRAELRSLVEDALRRHR